MAATAKPLVPQFDLPAGATQISVVVNENSLRDEVEALPAASFEASQPGSPVEGRLYVLSAAWGDEVAGTLAYYRNGAWTYWVPFTGMVKEIAGSEYQYDTDTPDDWAAYSGGGGGAVSSVNGATGAVVVPVPVQIAVSDETTDLTTGTAKVTFRMPFAMTLLSGGSGVRASVGTAPAGSTLQVDINEAGVSILSTPITIDAGEKTSVTAATPPVISDTALADDAEITIDIDQVGSSTPGKGLKVTLIGYKTP